MLKYPSMRYELVADLESLAGLDLSPGALHIAIRWVLDSSGLWDDPAETAIGVFLRDTDEAALVNVVVRLLDELVTQSGGRISEHDYRARPEWPPIERAAAAAHALLCQNDRRFPGTYDEDA